MNVLVFVGLFINAHIKNNFGNFNFVTEAQKSQNDPFHPKINFELFF